MVLFTFFLVLEYLWHIEQDGCKEDGKDVGHDDAPVSLTRQPSLVGVRKTDRIISFHSDSNSQEYTCRDRYVAEAITPGSYL